MKEQLLKEAQALEVSVELDGIFESANLTTEQQSKFATVFEQAVKVQAATLAESHITAIAASAEAKIEEGVEAKRAEIENHLVEAANALAEHTAADWLQANQVAIDRGIKADLFESMFGGLKALVVEHNVVLPEESVDVVAELEGELQEAKDETSKLFTTLTESRTELTELKRSVAVDKATANLTESQREKVGALIEGLEFSDSFEGKLEAIVEMAKASKSAKPAEATIVESTNINTSNENADGLNFVVEAAEPAKPAANSSVNQYVVAAKRI